MKCKRCGKRYSEKASLEKELNLNGCRYYCSRECCYLDYADDSGELICPCF